MLSNSQRSYLGQLTLLLPIFISFISYQLLSHTLPASQAKVAAVAVLMAIWWTTEAIPMAVTALLPIFLFPLFDISSTSQAARPYSNPLIFLFLGGFLLAIAMEKWNLPRRVALLILSHCSSSAASIVGGFMAVTAFLSMWVSNTASAMMMLPIGISVISLFEKKILKQDSTENSHLKYFSSALLLAVAYGANIGGVGTLIGSPPNAMLAAFVRDSANIELTFAKWLWFGISTLVIMLPLTWLLLVKVLFPIQQLKLNETKKIIQAEITKLNKISREEILLAIIFCLTALLWIFQPLLRSLIPHLKIDDTLIAIFAIFLLFTMPVSLKKPKALLTWEDTKQLPWNVLLLFGGGLSLADAIQSTGLANRIGKLLHLSADFPVIIVILSVVLVIIFLTEITSNTATAATFLPVVFAVTSTMSQPALILAAPTVLAASFAFMLPVATPPNAVVYASGLVPIKDMARAGLFLNLIGTIVITFVSFIVVKFVLV